MRPKLTKPMPRVALTCVRCDTSFMRMASEIRKNPNGQPYCSKACYRPSSPPVLSPDGETATVPLYGRGGVIRAYATIDAGDIEAVSPYRWHLSGGYAERKVHHNGQTRGIYLHRDLLGLPTPTDGREVDHIDRDRLNCRRSNMRVVTRLQNMQNHPGWRASASVHRGVTPHGDSGRWVAQVTVSGRHHHIGVYATEQEAAEAARAARTRLMPFSPD